MRKINVFLEIIFVAVTAATLILTGCSPYFGNSEQYRRGDWYGVADHREAARMEQDRLALDKLKGQPVMTASSEAAGSTSTNGYKGLVVNRSKSYGYTFEVFGPERKSWYLESNSRFEDYLIPGIYRYEIRRAGRIDGWGNFRVGPQIQVYDNEKYHWFFGTDH